MRKLQRKKEGRKFACFYFHFINDLSLCGVMASIKLCVILQFVHFTAIKWIPSEIITIPTNSDIVLMCCSEGGDGSGGGGGDGHGNASSERQIRKDTHIYCILK